MNPCEDCIVDMICTKKCPIFEVDIKRLQSDEEIYLKRCINNTVALQCYNLSNNIQVKICRNYILWLKNKNRHRDDDKPAVIWTDGTKYWYKNNKRHRDNHKPAIIDSDGSKRWYKNGVRYEFM